jgi:crotonobetaine/carnitine-CoA ligase
VAFGASPMRDVPPPLRTIPALVERQAQRYGDKQLVAIAGVERSYRQMRDAAGGTAAALAAAGVERGDRVAVMCENRIEFLDAWLGCAWLGAVLVPVNTAARGPQLEHMLRNSGARAIAVEPHLLDRLGLLGGPLPALERIWTLGEAHEARSKRAIEPWPTPLPGLAAAPVRPGDTTLILYTSGTTGPSKGVQCPHAQFYWWGLLCGEVLGVTEDDILHTTLPLFHSNALAAFMQALLAGATLVAGPRFSASRFWSRVVEADATVSYLLGAMASLVARQPPGPHDRAHRVRIILAPATAPELHAVFRERFGIALVDAYGSTETNAVIASPPDEQRPGTMGRLAPGFEARVVDEDDNDVPDGTPGELVLRHREPYAFATGYFEMPEKTVAAWRNLWVHTGDRVVRDRDGYYRFLDRIDDAIRRRGENISSWEVEQVLQSHPDVAAAAVVPVPSGLGDHEVMAFVIRRERAAVEPVELVRHCELRLAYFAVPRYLEFVDELPLTENGKVQKFVLRDRGVSSTTWDREAAGYVVER